MQTSWSERLEKYKKEFSEALVETKAINFGSFILTSGKTSSYYIDLRILPSYPEILRKVINILVDIAENEIGRDSFDRIAGIPTAGIIFSSMLALGLMKPFLYVRRDSKLHGMKKRIEGNLLPGDRILIVDDLVTTGGSICNAVDALRREGAIIEHALVLIDREEGGEEKLMNKGIKLHKLVGIKEVGEILYKSGLIDFQKYEILRAAKP